MLIRRDDRRRVDITHHTSPLIGWTRATTDRAFTIVASHYTHPVLLILSAPVTLDLGHGLGLKVNFFGFKASANFHVWHKTCDFRLQGLFVNFLQKTLNLLSPIHNADATQQSS